MAKASTTAPRQTGYRVRLMSVDDIPAVIALQARAFPLMSPWSAENLRRHIEVFPEGQLVVSDEKGRLLGSASSLLIDWDDYAEAAKWAHITDHGTFRTHNPLGKTLYGADMGVDPDARRLGIGSLFYEARKAYARKHGLKRILTGGRIPGYDAVSSQMSPRQYVTDVVMGKRADPTLSFQLNNGFVVLDVVHDYLEDEESRCFATLLEWLNPEYMTGISMPVSERLHPTLADPSSLLKDQRERPRRVRIAALQYQLTPIRGFDELAARVEYSIRSAADYGAHFVLFPEFFTNQLLSYLHEPSPALAMRRLAMLAPEYEALFSRLAKQFHQYIVAGTHPIIQGGELFNAAHLFTPSGRVFRQKKVHLTPSEKGPYQMSRGHGFYVYHTEWGRIAILVCYDIEFPEAARAVAEAGAEIIFVPSWTDNRQGFWRVRYCAHARAIENQVYVALTGTVGNLPEVPYISSNYGQAAILTPSDYAFARDGIAAEGTVNQDQMIIADVDLQLLQEQRRGGTVIPIHDLIRDAYDRVIHYQDP